jgi:C-terminal processing protease CtpA/Prc
MALNNSFWAQHIQAGDVIKKVNGTELTLATAQQVIGGMVAWQEGQEISMELEREGEVFELKTVLTKATGFSKTITIDENASESQLAVRNAWLNI